MTWRNILKIHPAADLFPLMSPEELRVLGKDIGANGLTSPIVLWRDQSGIVFLLDGRNRLDAIELEGRTLQLGEHDEIEVNGVALPQREISDDDGLDPYDYVISANILRRHLTAEQKGDLISAIMAAKPERSDRTIAAQTKVSPTTVGKVRAQLSSSGQLAAPAKRVGLDGKARKAPTQTLRVKVTSREFPIPVGPISVGESSSFPLFRVPAAEWAETAPARLVPEPAESPLDTVKRLVRTLSTEDRDAFKDWFHEFTKGRPGRPKGSTIASGAKPPTRPKTTDAGPAPAGDTVHG
jgi:hypothetical protein